MVAEGFFIHKRHEHIIPAGASVDEVIDVDIILFVLLIVVVCVANRLRCNGFVLNINSPTSSLVGKVGKSGNSKKSELTLAVVASSACGGGCAEDAPNKILWRLLATTGGSFRLATAGGGFGPVVATSAGAFWVEATSAYGVGSSATAFGGRLDGGRTIGSRGLEVAPPVRPIPGRTSPRRIWVLGHSSIHCLHSPSFKCSSAPGGCVGGSMSRNSGNTSVTVTFITASLILLWCISRVEGCMILASATSFNSPPTPTV